MNLWVIIYLCLGLAGLCNSQGSRCTTPDNKPGTCINIRQCEVLLNLLKFDKDKPGVIDFVRSSGCGYVTGSPSIPKVCCPNSNPGGTTTTGGGIRGMAAALLSPPNCGKTSVLEHRKIVGGSPAELGAWPWLAALGYRTISNPGPEFLCGGTLINSRYVITAAHCTNPPRKTLYLVRLGEHNLDSSIRDGANPIDIRIEKIIPHERYSPTKYSDDIALLRLKDTVSFSRFIEPICLPHTQELKTKDFTGFSPFVAGWGAVKFKGPSSNDLLEVQVPIQNNLKCRNAYRPKGTDITSKQICAGYDEGMKDACQGDSGGPMMWPKGINFYLLGVVSYGFRCAEPGFPGIYTKVSEYTDWISANMK